MAKTLYFMTTVSLNKKIRVVIKIRTKMYRILIYNITITTFHISKLVYVYDYYGRV